MSRNKFRLETQLIHAGAPEPRIAGAVATPVFQSATYQYGGELGYHNIRYIRLNNTPNHLVLHRRLAALEGAEAALVGASGMAAISSALLSVLASGDHLLVEKCLYGGTHGFVTHDLPAFGIAFDFIDANQPDTWASGLTHRTRAIYVETLTNPLLEMADLEAVVEFARTHALVSIVDNTFASPVNFRPAEHGFDLSIQSATKYLNGHSDIVAGVASGRAELIENMIHRLNHLGGTLDPHACFLLERGLKTLALRVRRQNESALAIACFLEAHPAVARVYYPGLERHPQHARAMRLLEGFGGMLSFELKGGVEAAARILDRLEIPISAPSLGGVETLITRPATTSHSSMTFEERAKVGISDGLIRLSVGIEAVEDLIEDLGQALE